MATDKIGMVLILGASALGWGLGWLTWVVLL